MQLTIYLFEKVCERVTLSTIMTVKEKVRPLLIEVSTSFRLFFLRIATERTTKVVEVGCFLFEER